MKLAAIYARVSTARQEEEQTIKTQIAADKELVQRYGFNLVREYTDEGWSGDILARPALDQLREDAKLKLWQVVVVYDPDRLARRYSYQELVMDELREAGIEVLFVTVSSPKNSEEKILHGVRGLFAEYERAKIGERFRMGKLRKVKEGHILVSEPLYGYRYIAMRDRVHGHYEINEDEARVVRMIFNWIDQEGATLREIVRRLRASGIKPRKSKRGVWATSTLSKMLQNRAYIGEAHWGSSYAVVPEKPIKTEKYRKNRKSSRRMKPTQEWLTIPVPKIIDRDIFERVRTRIEANFLLCRRNTKNEYLLAGKIYCPCGRKRAGEGPQKGKHLYYRCTDRVLSFPLPPSCKEQSIKARIADQLVWESVSNLMTSRELMQLHAQRWIQGQGNKARALATDIPQVQAEIGRLKEQEDRYNRAYGAGLFSIEQLKEYTVQVREKVGMYESQISKADQHRRELESGALPDLNEIEAFAEESARMLPHMDYKERKAVIGSVVERVVGSRESLKIYGLLPVATKSDVKLCINDRHGVDTPRHFSKEAKMIPFEIQIDTAPGENSSN